MTAEVRTTFGSVAFADHVPIKNAPVVDRLEDAGAIILGKTNRPDFAADFALVRIGKDTGGSIRVPASFCNLFGPV